MAALTSKNERPNKRRKLSPPEEEQRDVAKISKKKSKSSVTKDSHKDGASADVPADARSNGHNAEELPSVKDLASSESSLRRAAMKAITAHLESRSQSNPLALSESLQLWRGFWVAIYMHDSKNSISVQNLLRDIAHTFAIVSAKDEDVQKSRHVKNDATELEMEQRNWLTTYHTAFQETMVREWAGIDSHRLNKALLTYRFVTRELFQICFSSLFKESSEDSTQIHTDTTSDKKTKRQSSKQPLQRVPTAAQESQKAEALSNTESIILVLKTAGPLNPSNRKIPDGLRLHILDIWNDELFGSLDTLSQQNNPENDAEIIATRSRKDGILAALEVLRKPLEEMAKSDSGAQRHVRMRAKETLEVFDGKREEIAKE